MSEQQASAAKQVVEGSYDALKAAFSSAAQGSPPRISAAELPKLLGEAGMMADFVASETAAFLQGALPEVGSSASDQIGEEQLEHRLSEGSW